MNDDIGTGKPVVECREWDTVSYPNGKQLYVLYKQNDAWKCYIGKVDIRNFLSEYGYIAIRLFPNKNTYARYELCIQSNGKIRVCIADNDDNIIGYDFNYDRIVQSK